MVIKKDWLPTRDDDFYNKQKSYFALIVANKVAWGIPDAALNPLLALQAEYVPLYDISQDKKNRTSADVASYRDCRKRYAAAWRAFHQERVLHNSLIPVGDKVILVGKARDTEPSPHPVIDAAPIVGLRSLASGEVEVRCQTTTDATRFSMHPAATLIDYRYTLLATGDIPPADPDDCPKKDVSSRAKFIINVGAKNGGMSFWGYFRWLNPKKPRQEGPWTKVINVVIA